MEGLTRAFHMFFEYSEFDSPDEKNSYMNMDVAFLNKLSKARELAAIGLRSQAVIEVHLTTQR